MSEHANHEIIIIKRHDDEEHEHHSSAWKVAHADFMTAMMAFFLILWLINASDKDVRKAIANYFNPVNLAENISERKGLNDPEDLKDQGTSADGDKKSALKNTLGPSTGQGDDLQQGARERALFQDPYATLAEIAAQEPPNDATTADVAVGETGTPDAGSGDAQRDPFDPVYWQTATAQKPKTDRKGAASANPPPAGTRPDAAAPRPAGAPPPAGGGTAKTAPVTPGAAETAEQTAQKLEAALNAAVQGNAGAKAGPHVEVRATKEGLVVNLTDDIDFSMFASGSAEPDAKLVRAMEKVAQILSARRGEVVIRGHTDGRPFRSDLYDNWRLSTARAHMAYYMLARGGLDEKRITKIEGLADRQPKTAADPNAPENRRIEILLREPAT
ncbi:flagellar motor protein MotB [Aquabacter spiritensis]|uniref:Chemotaxis protein MotB n=1 Tax=Aquabacter spiritensis TaxID=933073 RepID=A0A4R3M3T1_9HYPH|nr:flagellar motor protein MotB [Aquabacter spiritensis]TCT07921.1 chemotaxis protein MotB [Aquabacter spiritensis]